MSEPRRPAVGIDLGGTTVKAGVVAHDGRVLSRTQRPTEVASGVSGVIANMVRATNEALRIAGLQLSDIDGVGVGSPGLCDVEHGTVKHGTNLGWHDVPVVALLREQLGCPVRFDNDANCAALGEQWCGAARGRRDVIMVTLGTGVGGALILNGAVYHGATGWGGELGHTRVAGADLPCNCGGAGCLETVASATAMVRAARQAIAAGDAAYLAEQAAAQKGVVDGRMIISAAHAGDLPARAIIRHAGEHLGRALAGMVTVLNPELIVVGGGVSRAGEVLLEPVRALIACRAMPGPAEAVKIALAALGNDAGLIGAASLVWR